MTGGKVRTGAGGSGLAAERPGRGGWYDRLILAHARLVVLVLLVFFAILGVGIRDFRIDASADALILEHDADLRYYREMSARYPGDDYLLLVYSPEEDLFADRTLTRLRALRADLLGLGFVRSVVTILDVPLLRNPPVGFKELRENVKTLDSPDVDLALARREFAESPLFQNMLVSPDLRTTAIQINLKPNTELDALFQRRTALREGGPEAAADAMTLRAVEAAYEKAQAAANHQRSRDIEALRALIDQHREGARIFLGGVPMIADDMIAFIKKDLRVFGIGMALFLIGTLGAIFRRWCWVLLPALCCLFSVVAMMGGLGWFGWKVTVISSNFISLQLIMTMALAIHLVVRYRELQVTQAGEPHRALVLATVHSMFRPCLYTTMTTMVGFCSLIFSDILPVINFGWMMTMGLAVSLLVTFLFLPAALVLLRQPRPPAASALREWGFTAVLARFTSRSPGVIFGVTGLLIVGIVVGITRLKVENSFIDYFREHTEIHRGMRVVDLELGGTTPLDILLELAEAPDAGGGAAAADGDAGVEDAFAGFEEFDDAGQGEKYWYTAHRLERIAAVHAYLERQPEIGKVLSLQTMMRVASQVRGSDAWDSFELALLFNAFPDEFRGVAVDPYLSIAHDQARVAVRIKDSMPSLRRDALLKRIRADLETELGLDPERFRLSGMMVLYNNMLQSLYRSQVQTIGFTILGIMIMFVILFRSFTISLIAIIPNVVASFLVLGVMGLLGIPLDMMTITIVAISIGIAVDNTIHYIHRFKHEVALDGDYLQAMYRCHATIGRALYYTGLTVVVGFSILVFSEFIPSNLFGVLTGLAITVALLAALTLLPRLIMLFKPFGR